MAATWLFDILGIRRAAINSDTPSTQRGTLRLKQGTGVTLAIADDGADGETEVTISASGPGGGASSLISRTRYVDQRTSVAEADQNGSPGAPFSTIAAAIASLLALEATETSQAYFYTLACYPGDYSAEDPIAWETSSYGIALSVVAVNPGDYLAGQVVLPALVGRSATGGSLALSGVYAISGISGGWNYVRAVGCKLAGTIDIDPAILDAVDCWLDQPTLTCGGLRMSGGEIQAATTIAVSSGGAACQFSNCRPVIGEISYAGAAGTVYVDSMANWAMGTTFTNCTKTVMV